MKAQPTLLATAALIGLALSTGPVQAATIGVNFSAGTKIVATSANPGIVAGANWNNVSGSAGSGIALVDDTATSTTARLTFSSAGTYSAFGVPATANAGTNMMYAGGLYGGGPSSEISVTVSSIPYAHYDVYVFASQDTANTTQLSMSNGTTTYYYRSAGAGNAGATTLLQTTSTTSGSPTAGRAQYQVFSGLSSSTLTLNLYGSTPGALSNNLFGIHIVQVPEPSSALLLSGVLGLAIPRRRRS